MSSSNRTFSHDVMLSPFTWRYGSLAMRALWSEVNKRRLWRRVWVALARAQHAAGLVSAAQLADVTAHAEDVDIDASNAVEAEIHHDLMAELLVFARQCPAGGGIIHLGATSMDVEDNAEALRIRDALALSAADLGALLEVLADLIEREAELRVYGLHPLASCCPHHRRLPTGGLRAGSACSMGEHPSFVRGSARQGLQRIGGHRRYLQ